MMLLRCGLLLALALSGCVVGGPERASDIQNLNAISDDISSVSMARSERTSHVADPNEHPTLPNTYDTSVIR